MLPPSETHHLARRLLAYEAVAATTVADAEPAILRVYEKLRRQLCTPLGSTGFQALAARALKLAKSKAPGLGTLQVQPDGFLQGLEKIDATIRKDHENEAGVVLLGQFLDLFLGFLGGTVTMQLVQDIYPDLNVTPDSGKATAFEDLVQEIRQLASVSERLESLADKNPALGELINIANTIRSVGTMLDVFALIRCKADILPQSEPEQFKQYLM